MALLCNRASRATHLLSDRIYVVGTLFIIAPIAIVGMILLAIYSHKKEKERRESLRAYAQQHGLFFDPDKVRGFGDRYSHLSFLQTGSNRYAYNILAGKWQDREMTVFDYHYETHSTDSKGRRQTHHHHFSVAVVEAEFPLREMTIRPEGIFDKMKAAFGWDDLDFESAEFSKRFHVSASDRRWAYDVITPRTMEFLLRCPNRELHFEGRLLAVRSNHRLDPDEVDGLLNMARTLLDGVPKFARGE